MERATPPGAGHSPRTLVVIGVVLSGTRDDGTAGLSTIKAHGGLAVGHDPEDALYRGMPASAIANVAVDAIVPSNQIAQSNRSHGERGQRAGARDTDRR